MKRLTRTPSLADRVDVQLTRLLHSIYANTDIAARFAMDEINKQARKS